MTTKTDDELKAEAEAQKVRDEHARRTTPETPSQARARENNIRGETQRSAGARNETLEETRAREARERNETPAQTREREARTGYPRPPNDEPFDARESHKNLKARVLAIEQKLGIAKP